MDRIATVGFAASLIAAQYPLYFESLELGILFIETNLFALLGALFYEWFAKKMVARWRAQQVAAGADADSLDSYWVNRLVIYINLAFISLLPIWGLPDVGLNSPAELFVAAAIYSAQIGSIQAFSRSLLAHFTPVGSESEFFAFFELTDKGTSWLGRMRFSFYFSVHFFRSIYCLFVLYFDDNLIYFIFYFILFLKKKVLLC